jgi:hypothetical protein
MMPHSTYRLRVTPPPFSAAVGTSRRCLVWRLVVSFDFFWFGHLLLKNHNNNNKKKIDMSLL